MYFIAAKYIIFPLWSIQVSEEENNKTWSEMISRTVNGTVCVTWCACCFWYGNYFRTRWIEKLLFNIWHINITLRYHNNPTKSLQEDCNLLRDFMKLWNYAIIVFNAYFDLENTKMNKEIINIQISLSLHYRTENWICKIQTILLTRKMC